jgi:hypothetical protein
MSDEQVQKDVPSHLDPQAPSHASHDPHRAVAEWTAEEWEEFHKSDRGAGGAVVVLMTAIFSIGLVLYSVIAIVVAS